VAPDSSSVTFYVDDAAATGGSLSLAIVPVMTDQLPGLGTQVPADTTQPFSVDIDKPGASSLAVTAPPTGGTGGTGGTGPGAGAPSQTPRSGSTAPAAGSGAGSSAAVGVPAGADAGAASAALAGALPAASGTTSAAGAGTAPLVASTTPAPEAGTTTARPAAAVAPLTDQRARNTALALLAVIGMGVIAMSSGQLQARAPRLLGGAARIAGARGVPAAAASTAGTTPAAGPVRGIGRFARARDRAARPLI
jgi:hypothetical protein